MTKAAKAKRIRELVDKWRPVLFLGEWTIEHKYVAGDQPENDVIKGMTAAAEIAVNYPYKTAYITTFDGFWNMDKESQDHTICHELCHCHTQELWDFCGNFANGKYHTPDEVWRSVETLTQRISIIAKWGVKAGGNK